MLGTVEYGSHSNFDATASYSLDGALAFSCFTCDCAEVAERDTILPYSATPFTVASQLHVIRD